MNNIQYIKPSGLFTNYIFKAIPLAFDESMSYYETLCGILDYLKNTVTPTVNNNAELLKQLEDYVVHYFDNLDVQQEINNKLDEMAESGELQEIIIQYLNVNAILAFNTVADLQKATNLIDGSFVKTYGTDTYKDGLGNFYKIRTLTNTDIVDNINIIALTNFPTLIAEKILDKNFNDLKSSVNNINAKLNNFIDTTNSNFNDVKLSSYPANFFKDKNLVVFGDSFSQEDIPNSENAHWVNNVISATKMNKFNFAVAGAGFARTGVTFDLQLNDAISQMSQSQKDNTAVVIVYGGYNDISNNMSDDLITSNCNTLIHNINNTFKNAKIILAPFNWGYNELSNEINLRISVLINRMSRFCSDIPCTLLKLARYWNLGIKSYFRNSVHPSTDGYDHISSFFLNAIYGGSEHVAFGETFSMLHGDPQNSYYNFEDGKVTICAYCKFPDTLTNYSGTMVESLPALCTPFHDMISPLLDTYGNYVGLMRFTSDGKMLIEIKELLVNRYCFMTPLTFVASANVSY
nr:MAG TPA: hydrolase [Caudoviricetes sp.]